MKKQKGKTIEVIILMAGEGRRMRPLTEDRPKALLNLKDGNSIFSYIVRSFEKISDNLKIIPIYGHGAEVVEETLGNYRGKTRFSPVFNPFYKETGPLISLWLGLFRTTGDTLVVINGDTMVTEDLTEKLRDWMESNESSGGAGLCVSKADHYSMDDMKVHVGGGGFFRAVGKHLEPNEHTLKSAGVFVADGEAEVKKLKNKVQELVKQPHTSGTKFHWHNVVNEMSSIIPVKCIETPGNSWCEMDTPEEFQQYKDDNGVEDDNGVK